MFQKQNCEEHETAQREEMENFQKNENIGQVIAKPVNIISKESINTKLI
jgi:hypothetical protein